ncbi:hypothetical protein AMTRI_Chr01g127090 [Amborella trichopoda]
MGKNLFDDSDGDDIEDISKIEVNEEFARRFTHNKRREDLQRLEELKKKGFVGDSEESSSEDEDEDEDGIVPIEKDAEIYEALVRVKNNDPLIYQKDVKFFNSDEDSDVDGQKRRSPKKKALYLKDVVARQLLENGPEFDQEKPARLAPKSYVEEQEELRKEFLHAAKGVSDDEDEDVGFFKEKKRSKEDTQQEELEQEEAKIARKLDEYFGEDDDLDENEMFLKNYLLNNGWVDKNKENKSSHEELFGISEDEEELDEQDRYESEYNFRFEEGAGDQVLGHGRYFEGSVRKKSNARKLQRKSKEERMALAEFERKEELKHLKNVKKKEIMDRLTRIRDIAGIKEDGKYLFNERYLEGEFDPEEHEKQMKHIFNEDYYEEEDADPDFQSDDDVDIEKPDFYKEDELLGLPKDWDSLQPGEGFLATRGRILNMKKNGVHEDVEGTAGELSDIDEDVEEGSGKKRKKKKAKLSEKVSIDKDLEEYFKLDYEDTIGDLKTRFKYRSVPANNYGLKAGEVLMTDDKELNQYVSLKKLAPYRTEEWKVSKRKRLSQKMRIKMVLRGENLDAPKSQKKHKSKEHGEKGAPSGVNAESGGDGSMSKRSRKRRKHAELKVPHSRFQLYAKTNPKTKKPRNQ